MRHFVVMPIYAVSERLLTLTLNAIKSFKDTEPSVAVVAVIDGPAIPGAVEQIQAVSDHIFVKEFNTGFANTCNTGFKLVFSLLDGADGYIICANNDIEVFPGWLQAMQRPFGMFDRVGMTGLISSKERIIDGKPISERKIQRITDGGRLDDWMMSGGLWMARAETLRQVGLFDEQFLRGGLEDVDLFLRVRDKHNLRIIMSGESCFWHAEGATRWSDDAGAGFGKESKAIEDENLKKFIKKWGFSYWDRQIWTQHVIWQP